jgi:hypothetical protein
LEDWEKSSVDRSFSHWWLGTRLEGWRVEGCEGGEWARSIVTSAEDPNILSEWTGLIEKCGYIRLLHVYTQRGAAYS